MPLISSCPGCILSNSLSACDQGRDFYEYLSLITIFPRFCFVSLEKDVEGSVLTSLGLILCGWSSQKRSGLPAGTHRSCARQAWTGPVLPQPWVPAARLLTHILATTPVGPQPVHIQESWCTSPQGHRCQVLPHHSATTHIAASGCSRKKLMYT